MAGPGVEVVLRLFKAGSVVHGELLSNVVRPGRLALRRGEGTQECRRVMHVARCVHGGHRVEWEEF